MLLAQALPFGMCITLISLIMNHFNICPDCMHRSYCVLTTQKDKVWSCSEFDEEVPNQYNLETVQEQQQKKELRLV
ncbi:hypothetical protein [Flavivirga sp. 57AJ16]|uniref:hypothetical protein n=1 Tax=Flavivirga sp. 57AJ16 TaxID=3025307 RepID=UPI0023668935|nr:hypothetical protein [Flavivirga sp. 57AJ16]MDD7886778.1 hypothetical protein [Flavivirga sp. 57AJ16]